MLTFSVLEQLYPREVGSFLLSQDQAEEHRDRKLNHLVMVYLLIAWSLMARSALRRVCDRLGRALRLCSEESLPATPTSAALCYRRRQLGVRVFRHLFQRLCRPFATEETPGSFAFGLRLMGIDGTKLAVAASRENRACFSPRSADASATPSPFPHLQATLCVEIGTHAIVDAIPALAGVGESRLAFGLLRSIRPGMLVLLDRNARERGFPAGPAQAPGPRAGPPGQQSSGGKGPTAFGRQSVADLDAQAVPRTLRPPHRSHHLLPLAS
jgi:hypothetical protein